MKIFSELRTKNLYDRKVINDFKLQTFQNMLTSENVLVSDLEDITEYTVWKIFVEKIHSFSYFEYFNIYYVENNNIFIHIKSEERREYKEYNNIHNKKLSLSRSNLNINDLGEYDFICKFNWKNIRSLSYKIHKHIIEDIYEYRRIIVDILLFKIKCIHRNFSDTKYYIISTGATGNKSLPISDYDINISNCMNLSKFIKTFHIVFRYIFHHCSSHIFDTNLYAHSYFFRTNHIESDQNETYFNLISLSDNINSLYKNYFYYQLSDSVETAIYFEQELFILLRFHLHENEIHEIFNKGLIVINSGKSIEKIRQNSFEKKEENETFSSVSSITDMTNSEKFTDSIVNLDIFTKTFSICQIKQKLSLDDNTTYEEKLSSYEKYDKYFKVLNRDTFIRNKINLLSQTNYYSNESYLSMGSFNHVVLLLNLFKNSPDLKELVKHKIITPTLLFHSMLENLSYIIINYTRELIYETINYYDVIYKDSLLKANKYIYRFLDAYYRIISDDLVTKPKKRILEHLEKIKYMYENVEENYTLLITELTQEIEEENRSHDILTFQDFIMIFYYYLKHVQQMKSYKGFIKLHLCDKNIYISIRKNKRTIRIFDNILNSTPCRKKT